jgi:hypothetical protein
MRDWLPWAPLIAASLHICEEFLVPGGFPSWYRRYTPEPGKITTRFLVIVNAALLFACLTAALAARTQQGIAYWLTISAVQCSNGCWHAWASYKSRSYSPGVVTGMAVYLPMAVYGYSHFVRSGAASIGTAAAAGILGGSYHLWSAAFHGRLSKPAPR